MGKTENSAAEALSQAHKALLSDLKELEQAVRPSSQKGMAELRARLETTRSDITEHFRFEEQNGYLDAVRKREPRLERTVQHLAQEHGELKRSLDAIIGEAGTSTNLSDSVQQEIHAWIDRVRQHEIRGYEVVQDAFNLDISPED